MPLEVSGKWAKRMRGTLLGLTLGVTLFSVQALVFHSQYSARIRAANDRLFELMTEVAQRTTYRKVAVHIETLSQSALAADAADRALLDTWEQFQNHFSVAPLEALESLRREIPALTAGIPAAVSEIDEMERDVTRLHSIYVEDYKSLLADVKDPPWYLQPAAGFIASRAGYRQAATMNRAYYLAQTGELGTSRVMLAGLGASVDDEGTDAIIYYTLARLQVELFRRFQDPEHYTAAVQYLRQSLMVDPGNALAKHLLDYLLSLRQSTTAPQSTEGRPETPSEGTGAAVSAEERIF